MPGDFISFLTNLFCLAECLWQKCDFQSVKVPFEDYSQEGPDGGIWAPGESASITWCVSPVGNPEQSMTQCKQQAAS